MYIKRRIIDIIHSDYYRDFNTLYNIITQSKDFKNTNEYTIKQILKEEIKNMKIDFKDKLLKCEQINYKTHNDLIPNYLSVSDGHYRVLCEYKPRDCLKDNNNNVLTNLYTNMDGKKMKIIDSEEDNMKILFVNKINCKNLCDLVDWLTFSLKSGDNSSIKSIYLDKSYESLTMTFNIDNEYRISINKISENGNIKEYSINLMIIESEEIDITEFENQKPPSGRSYDYNFNSFDTTNFMAGLKL